MSQKAEARLLAEYDPCLRAPYLRKKMEGGTAMLWGA